MTQNPGKLTCVAAIAGAHGVHGNVKIKSFTADPAQFALYGPLFTEQGEKLLTPKNARPVGKFFSLSTQEKLSREEIEALKSIKLFVPLSALPDPEEDEFYYSDLIGLTVRDEAGDIRGKVQAVHEFGAGDMLEIKPPKGSSFFHPFTQAAVPSLNLNKGILIIHEPEVEDARGDGAPPEN